MKHRYKSIEGAVKRGWISVQDRKPKSGKTVLVKSSIKFITTGTKIGIGLRWNKKDGLYEHWCVRMEFDDEHDYKGITHWQPLPR